mgnify:FL=1
MYYLKGMITKRAAIMIAALFVNVLASRVTPQILLVLL